MLAIVFSVVAVGLFLLVVGAIVRFSIVSALRTKHPSRRLRDPDVPGVERICGFKPPADLVELYREGTLVSLVEFSVVDKMYQPDKTWFFGGFYPLTRRDVSEQRTIHGLAVGIPIADDLNKGVYFVTPDGKVMFRPPGRGASSIEVAPSAAALSQFEVLENEGE